MLDVLVVLQNPRHRASLSSLLQEASCETHETASFFEARRILRSGAIDLVFTELRLKDGEGERLKRAGCARVLVTEPENGLSDSSLPDGFLCGITHPFDSERIQEILESVSDGAELAPEHRERQDPVQSQRSSTSTDAEPTGVHGPILGESPVMQTLMNRLRRMAPAEAPVLISGETGSGKELAARTLHRLSGRSSQPFIAVNCGAISPSLMESQLFGHERGSFTGATQRHRGVFERADGGTLFLDEITEMPVELQVKLLRALETGEFNRTGGEKLVSVNVRAMAATNRNPDQAVANGLLREDLYYRLKVLHVWVPPLRDRASDIATLARRFLSEISSAEGKSKTLSDETIAQLEGYSWPGNVRELRNAIYTAFLMSPDQVVPPSALPREVLKGNGDVQCFQSPIVRVPLGVSLREAEKRLILSTLNQMEGNKTRAADTLGISPKTLYNRLHSYSKGPARSDTPAG